MSPKAAEVDREALTDPAAFGRLVAEPCQPVVIRGAVADWPMAQLAEDGAALRAYLARFDAGHPVEAFVGDPAIAGRYTYTDDLAGFNFRRERMPLGEAIARITRPGEATESIYAGSLPTEIFLPGLAEDNALPFAPSGVSPRLWIGHASTIACHYDMMDNIACVVAGRRRFTLYPPDAIGDLYVGPIDHTMAGQPVALAAEAKPGDPRYPRFEHAAARAITVDLGPGDALYMPKLWWHRVEASGSLNILVNYWWDAFPVGPDQPFITLLLAMSAIAARPAPERAAWAAWFDHYAFRPDGHPLAHLPEERHGVLGQDPENLGLLRAQAMRMLRGG
ncbi:cupin [Sphingomonas paucimobilis]|uniref:Cupin-like domain-containing protein n=2 Tax=Sphingomonas paucimobilis TaxID=13689 RepID=A0A411LF59_SPHPI|nr:MULTISPECIES: cupin-like domain-containing protein [Sphingomonas]MBQ1480135.1 cupin-like domain-containing protein [Sphingomonas sp.]MCM3678962.1 cupin-like domain-containing protein [Sphingomonas paucimobilis]MDG5971715.1 cupin-like domain-containing protein [Sphingomonas paucimobilis]NNG58272.1 cupin-like domain-containing protein [Sphingomonas paucimobilis]QBE90962.1 cupin-like domain-containing protein [Sphingomonas paucimobilis]